MSLCDVCRAPGACCTKMTLNGGRQLASGQHFNEPMSREAAEHLALLNGVPYFQPVALEEGRWAYSCTRLQRDGRCGAYEDRPAVCRAYLPGEDPMCVHHWTDPERPRLNS